MYDFAVVGSGVSGGRIAYELTKAGARCLLIEAGREFEARTFPRHEIDSSTQLFWGGGLELSTDGRMGFLRAKCLGGTSVVNQALLDRFDDLAWEDWRARSGIATLTAAEMEPHYAACEKELSISKIPEQHWNRNARTFIKAFEAQGYGWKPLDRAQGDCKLEKGSDCIVCLGGCPRDSKQSSLITVIRQAREKGLEVLSGFEVKELVYGTDQVKIRGVLGANGNGLGGKPHEIVVPKVVLAAGAIGNTAILLRSGLGAKLPALGRGFCTHPQYMTYALFDEPVDAHKGAFQAVKSEDRRLREQGFKLENVFAPPIATAMLVPGMGPEHLARVRKFRYLASMEVAIRDEPAGRLTLAKDGRVKIDKSLTAADQEKSRKGLALVRELFEVVGAREIIPCHQVFGLHLMGGCAFGTDPARSVVDPEFRVHGFPNLIVADSSVFPSAPGINPSFTIMALSQRAGQALSRR
ncbi:MAG: GMC family oxidoreductase [Oligoflexia bacterium]|nr:GMC family oxidoreductase [Oligoflexia bacterium]